MLGRLGLHPAPIGHGEGVTGVASEVPKGGPEAEHIARALVDFDVRLRGFAVAGASLEDRFVDLTGEGFDVAG